MEHQAYQGRSVVGSSKSRMDGSNSCSIAIRNCRYGTHRPLLSAHSFKSPSHQSYLVLALLVILFVYAQVEQAQLQSEHFKRAKQHRVVANYQMTSIYTRGCRVNRVCLWISSSRDSTLRVINALNTGFSCCLRVC